MNSSFTNIRVVGAVLAAGLLFAVLATGGACTRVQVEETNVEFTRSSGSISCGPSGWGGASGTDGPYMDTYVIQIFELLDVAGATRDACERCVATGEGCKESRETCLCGGRTTANPAQLRMNLSGTHLGSLDYEDLYCLRVVAIDRSSLDGDPPASCDCAANWLMPALIPDNARLCAVSPPYSAGPLDVQLEVRCPNDGRAFADCIGLSMM
jgi:hypothetical protein